MVLAGKNPENENHVRTMRRTLTLLWKEGIASRIQYVEPDMDYATRSFVYGLSDAGARDYGGKTFDEHSERTLDHELEITEFHIALARTFTGPRFNIRWYQSNIKRCVNPDVYFSITDYELPPEKNTAHYFLEIERAKIGNIVNGEPSIVRKLGKYYDFYDSDQCEKEWGFRKFRVITVVRNSEKRYNLCARLIENYNHRMFWITTEPHVRENIGGEIFKTPKDFTKVAYSFN